MDSDPSCLVTIVFDSRAFGHEVEAVTYFVPERLTTLVALAQRLLARYRIADPAFDADDAVQAALLKVFKALRDRKVGSLEAEEDFVKLLRHELKQRILSEREREHTCKRGGSGASPDGRCVACRHDDVDIETIDSRYAAPEDRVVAEDQVESLLGLLDIHDPCLRNVAIMKADGFTHQEIASRLGRPLSAVERQVRLIKEVLGPCYPGLIEKISRNAQGSRTISGY